MNAVGKKTKLSRDFRNNYAQKARFEDGNIWLEPVKNETDITERGDQGRDQHQGSRPTSRNKESRDESKSTKGRDRHRTKAEIEARKYY